MICQGETATSVKKPTGKFRPAFGERHHSAARWTILTILNRSETDILIFVDSFRPFRGIWR